MPKKSALHRLVELVPDIIDRFVYICPSAEVCLSATFTAGGGLKLAETGCVHKKYETICHYLEENGRLCQLRNDTPLQSIMYTEPWRQGRRMKELLAGLQGYTNCVKANARSKDVLSTATFLALVSTTDQLVGHNLCSGIPCERFSKIVEAFTAVRQFALPPTIVIDDGLFRHRHCLQVALPNQQWCRKCHESRTVLEAFEKRVLDDYCPGFARGEFEHVLAETQWDGERQQFSPGLTFVGDTIRHKYCNKMRSKSNRALCRSCGLAKARLQIRQTQLLRKPRSIYAPIYTPIVFLTDQQKQIREILLQARKACLIKARRILERQLVKAKERASAGAVKEATPDYIVKATASFHDNALQQHQKIANPRCFWGGCLLKGAKFDSISALVSSYFYRSDYDSCGK